ncbi:MAG: 3-deoxy-7-phosphoheptulonate synthase [Planctomycetota bacterium]|jgi:3-deoxy-7-phosphoheptulonate synthase
MKPLQVLSPPKTDGPGRRIVRVRHVEIGGDQPPVVIAGPCAVESYDQTIRIARGVRAAGGDILRGGAFKPRTSPYDFQGLGQEGLEILKAAREETGLPIVTEVMEVGMIELVAQFADMLQIGSRNMQNYPLLRAVGRQPLPVLLKRGMAATLEEWLCAAEYIAVGGNDQIALCERGIRTAGSGGYDRNTLDLNVVEAVHRHVDLPVIVDPSHGTGRSHLVPPASLAAIASGADGLIIEVVSEGTDKAEVLCDGPQSIRPDMLARIVRAVPKIKAARAEFEAPLPRTPAGEAL